MAAPLSVRMRSGHTVFTHRGIANRAHLGEVHSGDGLAADQKSTVRIGDREKRFRSAYPSPVRKYPLKSMHQSWLGAVTIENGCELGAARRFFLLGLVSPARLRIWPTVLAAGQFTFGFMRAPAAL